jgi:hypothetical protein
LNLKANLSKIRISGQQTSMQNIFSEMYFWWWVIGFKEDIRELFTANACSLDFGKIRGMVSGGDAKERRKNYKKFVMNGIMKDTNLMFWNDVKGQVVLGTEEFLDWVYGHFFLRTKKILERFRGSRI